MFVSEIKFPEYRGVRCLMMPYVQGDPSSVPEEYRLGYEKIISSTFIKKGDVGYLTIDESPVSAGKPHRGKRAKHGRALHTEAGLSPEGMYCWGGPTWSWGGRANVILERDVEILLANNIDKSCALWEDEHEDTSDDGDIGDAASLYPYDKATIMQAGHVHKLGILNPHESLAVKEDANRQFLRIVGSGVHGRESYFTENTLM